MEKSDWTSCCKGPILKKDLEDNLWCCNLCGKHHRINSRQRFDVFFEKKITKFLKHQCQSMTQFHGKIQNLIQKD